MPGAEKKWGVPEERDLAMAVILAQSGDRPKYDWPKIHETMMSWGYSFSRDAINQHWSKKIMKDFRERHGGNMAANKPSSAASTPKKATSPRKRAAPKSKTPVKDEDTEDALDEEVEDEEDSEDLRAQKASIKKKPAAKKRKLPVGQIEDEFLQPMDDESEI